MPSELPTPRRLVLILGGARSGKSRYAEELATQIARSRPVLYLATARPADEEMRARVAAHQAQRPATWVTREAPLDPADALRTGLIAVRPAVALLDCITLLVSNVLLEEPAADTERDAEGSVLRVQQRIDDVLAAYAAGAASLILVSNEVGMGIVPAFSLGRAYRDLLGRVNARLAEVADAVLLMVAGLPVDVKALSTQWRERAPRFLAGDD